MYKYEEDLALDILQGLICHKSQPKYTEPREGQNYLNDPRRYGNPLIDTVFMTVQK